MEYTGVEPGSPAAGTPRSPVQARELTDFKTDSPRTLRVGVSGAKACISLSVVGAIAAVCCVVLVFGQARPTHGNDGVLSVSMPALPWLASTTTTTSTFTQTTTTRTTTVTETSTSTSTTTSTDTTTSTSTTYPYPSLFCFSVMRSHGPELSLVRMQLAKGASIFACEDWAVYSDKKTWLTPGPPVRLDATALNTSLVAKTGIVEHILNVEIFMEAFDQIRRDVRFQYHDYVVKVDPDAVFLPDRLKSHLKLAAPHRDSSLYFRNCKASFRMYGALEVYTRKALETYFKGQSQCKETLPWKKWGEDMWMAKCLELLKVPHKDDFGLLDDAYCGADPSPCISDAVVFHPFKAPDTYMHCLHQADPKRAKVHEEIVVN